MTLIPMIQEDKGCTKICVHRPLFIAWHTGGAGSHYRATPGASALAIHRNHGCPFNYIDIKWLFLYINKFIAIVL